MINLRRVMQDGKNVTIITLSLPGDFKEFVALRDCERGFKANVSLLRAHMTVIAHCLWVTFAMSI